MIKTHTISDKILLNSLLTQRQVAILEKTHNSKNQEIFKLQTLFKRNLALENLKPEIASLINFSKRGKIKYHLEIKKDIHY